MPEEDPLIGSGEVARRLGVGRRTVSGYVRDGVLSPAQTTPGGKYRFRWSEVQKQVTEYNERRRAEQD